MNIATKIEQLKTTMQNMASSDAKYAYIIEQGKNLAPMQTESKTDTYLIEGCISKAWIIPEYKEGSVYFVADSEALIVKGIIAMILSIYNGHTPSEILEHDGSFLEEAGIVQQLSMNRRNGLANVLKQIFLYAIAFKTMYRS